MKINNIEVKLGNEENKHKSGIHLLNPNASDIRDAIQRAVENEYRAVYIYGYDSLDFLFS